MPLALGLPAVDPAVAVEVAIVVAGFALWFALFGIALLLTRAREVQPAPSTQDFGGDEPPAVVSLLTSRWELTEDAVESTLIDLAARKILEFRQPANDPIQTTIHVRQPAPSGLNAYEQRVLERVCGLAVGGVVPLTALTFRDPAQATAWTKRVNAAIVADARTRGVSQRRFSPTIVTGLVVTAVIPAAAFATAIGLHATRTSSDGWGVAIGAVIVTWAALATFAGKSRGERDTELGRTVAARWLGLKTYLRSHKSFADLPPAAVAVWDRYLSYGDAVGATRVCSAVIDLGMGNRKRVWSSFGGTWHRVRVRYPKFWRRYGQTPVKLIVKSVAALGFAYLVLRNAALPAELAPAKVSDYVDLATNVVFLAPLIYGIYTLVSTVIDLITPVTITGEVLWLEVWKSHPGGEDSPPEPWLHYLAIDDGRDGRTVAWGCPSATAGPVSCGDVVTLTARRWTRRITAITIVEHGKARAIEVAAGHDKGEDTENMILNAMGVAGARGAQALASAVHPPDIAPATLVTIDEVSRALGMPVAAKGLSQASIGPMAMEAYHTAGGGKRVLYATVTTGPTASLAIRMRRRYAALPGIGDEAFAGENWAIGRRGDRVIMFQLHGPARQVDPRNVYWLLSTAIGRLPA